MNRYTEIDLRGTDTLLLDRDGVINVLRPGDYVKTWDEFEFIPGILEAWAIWARMMRHIFIVTNQRGVGKGVMSEQDLKEIHRRMTETVAESGGRIDGIYYCTATDSADPCRKPQTGMFSRILSDFPDVRREKCLMIGDSDSDMAFAANCGIRSHKVL